MNAEKIMNKIKEKYPNIQISQSENNWDSLEIESNNLRIIVSLLKEDPELSFDFLICCFAVDYLKFLEMIYVLHSYAKNHQIILRTKIDRKKPRIASISDIYPTANWHERESYDLFGVAFSDHPDLRRLLLPDDWEGHPMLKGYTHENLIRRPETQ